MNYKKALKDMMKTGGYTYGSLCKIMGVSNRAILYSWLRPVRRIDGRMVKTGMFVETFIRLVHAMGGKVILEWPDPDPNADRHFVRWRVDNTDYSGLDLDKTYLVQDEEYWFDDDEYLFEDEIQVDKIEDENDGC